jgi:flagellar motor protein MotB
MPRYRDDDRPAGRYRDAYDRDRPRYRPVPEPDNGGNTAVKIIAILGAVVVAISLVCGGLAYYVFYSAKQGAQRVGDGFADVVEKQQQQFALEQQRIQKQMEEQHKLAVEQAQKEEKERKEQQAKAQQERKQKLADKAKATAFANTFLGEVKAGRTAQAYAMTSAGYRRRVSQEQFAEQLRDNANNLRGVGTFRDRSVGFEQDFEPPFSYNETSVGKGGFIKVEVTVTKEDDGWKVDQFFAGLFDPHKK